MGVDAASLAGVRADAEGLDTIFVVIRGPRGAVAIPSEHIVGKSDDELRAFLDARLEDSATRD